MFKLTALNSRTHNHPDLIKYPVAQPSFFTAATWYKLTLLPALPALSATLLLAGLLAGCQPTEPPPVDVPDTTQTEKTSVSSSTATVMSESAIAYIEEFEPLYVEQVLGLQQRLQAEYEAFKAADTTSSEGVSSDPLANQTTIAETAPELSATNDSTDAPNNSDNTGIEGEINVSAEVGERDLEVLKRISFEPRSPTILTETQITQNYQQATRALYEPGPLNAGEIETLLSVAELLPQLFEHPEIAERLNIKSPTLARLIVQQQIWSQIEADQAADIQRLKQAQQAEFESLMAKFNDTIEGYDEQIAKYEQTLESFQ